MKYSKFNLILKTKKSNIALFNTLTGNCFIINSDIKKMIEKNDIISIKNNPIYNDFIDKSIVISDNIDENLYVEYFINKSKFDTSNLGATILLSWNCNLSCVYCYEGANSKYGQLNKETSNKIIKFIKIQAIRNRTKQINITLFGGEPLINIKIGIHILKEIKNFSEENNIIFNASIISNGTLFTKEIFENLWNNNCKNFQITLDGKKEFHDKRRIYKDGRGSFEQVIECLKILNDNNDKAHTVIRVNIDKENINGAYDLLEYIGNNGKNFTNCSIDFGIVRSSTSACSSYSSKCFVESEIGEILEVLLNKAQEEGFLINSALHRKWIFCGLYSDTQYTISPEGDIYKCWEHTGEKNHKMGEIDENGNFIQTRIAYFDWMSHNPLNNDDCKNCVYLPLCGGGCGVISYNETGTYHAKGCFKIKGVIESHLNKYIDNNIYKLIKTSELYD